MEELYPSDLTEAEWQLAALCLPGPSKLGRPPRYEKRAILNGIFYVVRSGCSWRMLPRDLPPWRIVYYYFMTWERMGLWEVLHEALRDGVRLQSAKKKPQALRYSTRRVLKHLTTAAGVASMRARRSWDENGIWSSIRWG
jgi:putative transposase